MKKLTLGFIGLGLIGGSIAKALKASIPAIQIIAYDVNKEALNQATADGIVDTKVSEIDDNFSKCDYIFLCAPVSKNEENLLTLKKYISPACILTDVGSVKTGIHQAIDRLGLSEQFIGGHPMAGSERFGYLNSKAGLLENAYYILTPADEVSAEKVESYKELVLAIGAIPLVLDAARHDFITAAISHLPHVISASLVNLVKASDSEDETMKMIAAGGFKDITRISSSSPDMWQQICLTNTENILTLLDRYISSLEEIRKEISGKEETALYDFFNDARLYRDSFIEASSGPIKKSYAITIDIADKTGALASIATLLASHQISIKNIGIVHNRELAEGALRIEFYGEEDICTAGHILKSKGYLIHEKGERQL